MSTRSSTTRSSRGPSPSCSSSRMRRPTAHRLDSDPYDAARRLLGAVITAGEVRIRIVEVEAYGGPPDGLWPDSAAHSFRGPTPRNGVMFGPAGHLYVYLSYGMHLCVNVSCGPAGEAAAVLLRAGEVIGGQACVAVRRPAVASMDGWARGPGNFGRALGVSLRDNGTDVFATGSAVGIELPDDGVSDCEVERGPRVGVSTAADRPWRLWLRGSTAVSAYRRSPRAEVSGRSEG